MKKFFSCALSIILSLSMISPAFAAAVAEVCVGDQTLGQGTEYDDLQTALYAGSEADDSTVYLKGNHTVDASSEGFGIEVGDTIFNLNGNTLTVTGSNSDYPAIGVWCHDSSTITNGTIKFDEKADLSYGILASQGNLSVDGVDIEVDGKVDVMLSAGMDQGTTNVEFTDSSISAKDSTLFENIEYDTSNSRIFNRKGGKSQWS